ncbi:Alkaline-phosphatase-like family protein [Raphanus sativus]|nr:Alkaline-phosphatase-like family protein [Raphanus sativus]
MIGRVIKGLKKRKVFGDVHVILLGDHGMVTNCDKKVIYIDDLADWIKIPADWIQDYSPVLVMNPRWGKDVKNPGEKNAELVAKMNEVLSSGKVENGEFLKVYLKDKLPKRLHYSESSRIPPIIGMVGEGLLVRQNRTNVQECSGDHGYDNMFFSMRSIFIGHGPRFRRGKKVPSFENVQIYNVVAEILGLRPAPNNGSSLFTRSLLRPSGKTAQLE